jgi:hypothetical protein
MKKIEIKQFEEKENLAYQKYEDKLRRCRTWKQRNSAWNSYMKKSTAIKKEYNETFK